MMVFSYPLNGNNLNPVAAQALLSPLPWRSPLAPSSSTPTLLFSHQLLNSATTSPLPPPPPLSGAAASPPPPLPFHPSLSSPRHQTPPAHPNPSLLLLPLSQFPNPNPNPTPTLLPALTPRPLPLTIFKCSLLLSLSLFAIKRSVSLLLSPFFWTYFSLSWIFWPWILALALAAVGLFALRRCSLGSASALDQLAVVTAASAWLTLVPPAHFNGFLEGWPLALFLVYHYFFFFEPSVRRRLYGDLYPRVHDPKWDVRMPPHLQVGFAALVMIGHWLAAYEGPELHLVPGGWANLGIWVLIFMVLFMRYHSVLYLAKYSEKVAVPTAVVQFGPYRWVRHPIYASTMLLFAVHCITLRAPLSLLFLVAVCLLYYGWKADAEEALMVENFGERYTEYMNKVSSAIVLARLNSFHGRMNPFEISS
uniref:Protein-S-isoprenylcysteine O-methyltransferase n=1 Tax=Ananas comosus var. bracteatus TaxID=296719 RepID=A0A6V7Q9X4_ANACO|nr:unnamed protein product [Ananas comosus var. bracteatus]